MISRVNEISAKCVKGAAVVIAQSIVKIPNTKKGYKGLVRPSYMNGNVVKETYYGGVNIGCNYQNTTNNAMAASGATGDYKPSDKSHHKYYNAFFNVSKKDPSKYYLHIQWAELQSVNITPTYKIDGVEATPEQVKEIRFWSGEDKPKDPCKRQMEQGIKPEHERHFLTLSIENVLSITQGSLNLTFWLVNKGNRYLIKYHSFP